MKSLISTQYADMDKPLRAILAPRYEVHPTEVDLQFEMSAFSGEWVVVRVDNEQVERMKIADAKALLSTSHTAEKENRMRLYEYETYRIADRSARVLARVCDSEVLMNIASVDNDIADCWKLAAVLALDSLVVSWEREYLDDLNDWAEDLIRFGKAGMGRQLRCAVSDLQKSVSTEIENRWAYSKWSIRHG